MVKKIYISLEAIPLSVDVMVGERLLSADFVGGLKHPIVLMPKFMTVDEDMQAALEASASYQKSFTLLSVEKEEVESTEQMNFATVTEAKTWLNKNKKVPYTKLVSREKVLIAAQEVGVELTIENE